MTTANCVLLLKSLSSITPEPENTADGLQMIVHLIVAICKQGTISSQFADKIRNATSQDLGSSMRISISHVAAIWSAYGQYINETNVESLMTHFLNNILSDAIRLNVTIRQAKYQALTVYQTIGRAMLTHSLLSWHLVDNFAKGELEKYRAAITLVDKNGYYGFSKELNAVKAANFRHLGYLAKELMVQCTNETHLRNNRVFSIKPPKFALIDKIVAAYKEEVEKEGENAVFGGVL